MIEFRLPSLGSDMDEGTLVEWRVRPGDVLKKGQVVAVVDTTKAAIDVECWDEGTVHELLAQPGMRLPVGAALALLRAPGESAEQVERELAARRAPRRTEVAPPAGTSPAP
ncbi:MAG: 2-oxo acid dehydrogenase subunit E2, partial [Rubrivivax sp.]|nr:2-oxo acid dehydrogenase subunit E2 [Rubrivivax sp.]